MSKRRIILWLIILLTVAAIYIDWPGLPFKLTLGSLKINEIPPSKIDLTIFGQKIKKELDLKLGLDLQGGTHLVLSADMGSIEEGSREKAHEAVKEVVERRVNFFGVSEPTVQRSKVGSDYRVIIELPGIKDINTAKELIGQTAKLEFREFKDQNQPPGTIPTLENTKETGISGKDLKSAQPDYQSSEGGQSTPVVAFELTGEGGKKFSEVTKRLIEKPLAVFLDDQVISAPTVQSEISTSGVITGLTANEAKKLAIHLNAGALPAPVKIISEQTIGPTLGAESVTRSIIAAVVGLGIVTVFMVIYYGVPGLLADIALFIYASLVIAIFKLLSITLTLAGIAAFILSIGMAVDANILIFERMREEIRSGRNRHNAIEIGFSRAWNSIRDSNVSSLITSFVLWWFGTGSVRGFALTLALGIIVSMFTAVILTRNFLRMLYRET